MSGAANDEDWQAQRRAAAAAQAERAERARMAETARAREMIAGFVADARAAGIATSPLLARAGESGGTYRTPLVGWYLNRNGTLGVDESGEYYVLVVPKSLRARLSGVRPVPTEPPLQVGRGARDGESIALDALLALRLAGGDEWPIVR